MRLTTAVLTDVGRVRENNEDAYLVDPELSLFAIADGMGGHRGGEVASSTAIEALHAAVAGGHPITAAIELANDAVYTRAVGDADLTGMGTTMTAVVAPSGRTLLVGHVGDSRGYLLRAGELQRLTEDHSLVEELVRDGRITSEQAEHHPQRSIITRALGIDPAVDVATYRVEVQPADRVLLCSDGLTDMVREDEIARLLGTGAPEASAQGLVHAAIDHGGSDNVTVLVIEIVEVDTVTADDDDLEVVLAETVDDPADASTAAGDEPDEITDELPVITSTPIVRPARPEPPKRSWWQRHFGRDTGA